MVTTKSILWVSLLLAGVILLFGLNGSIDVWVQNHFYDSQTHQWLIVEGERPWLDFLLYDGIKRGLIIAYVLLLLTLVIGYKTAWVQRHKKQLSLLILSAIFVPMVIVSLKNVTNTPCPKDCRMYGGIYPNIGVLDPYPKEFCQKSKIRCWPAGHASFGFALMAFYFVFERKRHAIMALAGALTVAWSMGGYKILKGDHFLSHTIVAMIMGWLIILILKQILDRYMDEVTPAHP